MTHNTASDVCEKHLYKRTPQGELHLHVFQPEGGGDRPRAGVVFFFGGGWVKGTPTQFYPQCRRLSARGMVAACAEYRVKDRHGTPPAACVADGRSAVRWMRVHAAELGLDPARLAAGGGSAGGHVAAGCALLGAAFDDPEDDSAVDCRPDALVLFNPVVDTTPGGWMDGDLSDGEREAYSPVHHIAAGAPPTVILQGRADTVTPRENAERFARRMGEAGSRCDLHLYDSAGHGFFNPGEDGANRWYEDTCAKVDDFFVSLGFLEAR